MQDCRSFLHAWTCIKKETLISNCDFFIPDYKKPNQQFLTWLLETQSTISQEEDEELGTDKIKKWNDSPVEVLAFNINRNRT